MLSLDASDRRNGLTTSPEARSDVFHPKFLRYLVIFNGMIPLSMLAWDAYHGQIGANAVNQALHITGIVSLVFLFLSLAITPLRWATGWGGWIGFRRALGLYAFFYSVVHLLIYFYFDRAANLSSTLHEIWTRRFLQIGTIAILLMTPLAVTSTNAMVRRIGAKQWKLLHRLAYLVAALGVIHYFLLVKSDVRQPVAFGVVLTILLLPRIGQAHFARKNAQKQHVAAVAPAPDRRKSWKGELRIVHLFDETPNVRTFRLAQIGSDTLPFEFRPGQFLNLQLMIDGKRVNRSYTIASSPTRTGYCELTVKREEQGLASRFLHGHCKVGDLLKVTAPAGRFVFDGTQSDSVVLIGGGVGITPLMSITRYLTDLGWQGEIYLLIIAKTEGDIIFQDELQYLQKRFPNLHVKVTLTRVDDTDLWPGDRGRPTCEWLTKCVPRISSSRIYLCGPNEMMESTRRLLFEIGVDPAQVLTEAFVSPSASRSVEREDVVRLDETSFKSNSRAHSGNSSTEPVPDPAELLTAEFLHSRRTTSLDRQTSLLEAAEAAGVDLPYECRSGICGQCKLRLASGSVTMEIEDALTLAEKQEGWILACQSHCETDVKIEA